MLCLNPFSFTLLVITKYNTYRIHLGIKKLKSLICIALITLLNYAYSVSADTPDPKDNKRWHAFTFENDLFAFSDDGYTNGVAYAWGYAPYDKPEQLPAPAWITSFNSALGLYNKHADQLSIGYGVAQNMYTPNDLEATELIEDDRPYAGTLLWGTRARAYDQKVANSRGLTLGVVGPASMAEQAQTLIHDLTGGIEPMGWDNQVSNEPVFRIDAEHLRRLYSSGNDKFDLISYSTAGVGNLRSDIGTGLILRFGDALASSYAYVDPDPARAINVAPATNPEEFQWHLQAGILAQYVFNDITLDGNTFKNGPSVDLEHWQTMASAGIAWNTGNWGWLFSMYRGGDEWQTQQEDTAYGALSVSYRFSAKAKNPQ